ncbi:hypothetical protein [Halobacillus mangrovi]|uniref:Uncharacterized protein n=1 Tax=Halobacillus mangrovi TaxID=402384 RepID=A0A1W5ZSF6_9BACI|nr:hypothetical protein [Halobacillus mangrovi]ARI76236.1 hypothetical protein HM131_05020 [Halobacillus mangrovi]
MKKCLTDEHLEQLGKVFVYYTYGISSETILEDEVPAPAVPFYFYVRLWLNDHDPIALLSTLHQYYESEGPSPPKYPL